MKTKSKPVIQSPNYWDCECPKGDYIHPKSVKSCSKCGAEQDEQPDSRVNEINKQSLTMCEKYPYAKVLPNEEGNCSLCGGDCNKQQA